MATIAFATKSRGLTSQQTVQQKGQALVEGELVKTKYDDGLLTMSNTVSGASIFSFDFKDKSNIKVSTDFDNLPHVRLPSEKGTKRKASDATKEEEEKAEPKKKKPKTVETEAPKKAKKPKADKEEEEEAEEKKEEEAAPKPKAKKAAKNSVIGEVKKADPTDLFVV